MSSHASQTSNGPVTLGAPLGESMQAYPLKAPKFRAYTSRDIDQIPQLTRLPAEHLLSLKAVASVIPFRVNSYVLEQLINWDDIPNDPIFQLTIPQPGMLREEDLDKMRKLIAGDASRQEIKAEARRIQMSLNPHPAGQMSLNVPIEQGETMQGLQHKYRETVLFFPSSGQTCHAYCTYCFRWAQFVGIDDLKFAARQAEQLVQYLKFHPEVTDVLFTGGDPMIMRTRVLRRYIEPLLEADLPHLTNIRFGTKAPAYWPYRFTTEQDADELMKLFEEMQAHGKHVAIMAHYSHPNELSTPAAEAALQRLRDVGAVVRCQAPLIRHVNDNVDAWATMWKKQVQLGAVPYYMFVERDTGPKEYFKVPLHRVHQIYHEAYKQLPGLARTVRGPSMSATPGKVAVDGVTEVAGEKVFVLKFLQARNPDWVGRPFFAKYDEEAAWLNELTPAFGASSFFYEDELRAMKAEKQALAEARDAALAKAQQVI